MKHQMLLLCICIIVLLSYSVLAAANPAAVYCNEMKKEFGGYEYTTKVDANGNQYGECILPDGSRCEEWKFLKGKCGKDFSYCTKKGLKHITKKNNSNEYLACGDSSFGEKPVEELMNLSNKLGGIIGRASSAGQEASASWEIAQESYDDAGDYSSWDWRDPPAGTQYSTNNFNYFDSVYGWVSPVKDQAGCGSCWSFSSYAAAEAKYEITENNPELNPDLSEQYAVSCDHGCYRSAPNVCQNGCTGGFLDLALRFMKESGSADESCLPYGSSELPCSARCADYSQRLWTVSDYVTTWPDGGAQQILSADEIKQRLIDNGPLAVTVYSGWSEEENQILRCYNDHAIQNHAVLLIGYKDTGDPATSYWIIKNSWGTGWGQNGFGRIGFDECNFGGEFDYATSVNAPANYKPAITLNYPENRQMQQNSTVGFSFKVETKNSESAKCNLIVDGSATSQTEAADNENVIISQELPDGAHSWKIACWENNYGAMGSSETRTIFIGVSLPKISIASPLHKNYKTKWITVNITSSYAQAVWWFNGTKNLTYSEPVSYKFPKGKNTIIAYANNSAGLVSSANVTFSVKEKKCVLKGKKKVCCGNEETSDSGIFKTNLCTSMAIFTEVYELLKAKNILLDYENKEEHNFITWFMSKIF